MCDVSMSLFYRVFKRLSLRFLHVFPSVQLVDSLEVVSSRPYVVERPLWGVLHRVVIRFS